MIRAVLFPNQTLNTFKNSSIFSWADKTYDSGIKLIIDFLGVADILSLAVGTASYYQKLGLLSNDVDVTDEETNINILFSMALQRLAFMPFGYLVDKYRWDLYRFVWYKGAFTNYVTKILSYYWYWPPTFWHVKELSYFYSQTCMVIRNFLVTLKLFLNTL